MPKLTPILRKGMGWLHDRPDQRDFVRQGPPLLDRLTLPASVDLRPNCPPVFDQGQLGSCTANALGGSYEFLAMKQGLAGEPDIPSRLFLYYNERVMEGDPESDAGAFIRDGAKALNQQGICSESMWPYDTAKFADKPPDACYANALLHTVSAYQRLPQRSADLRYVLSQGLPFVFGFTVFDSFESDYTNRTGVVTMPRRSEGVLGGHAVMAVGYEMIGRTRYFIVRNSWGPDIGDHGYYYFPERYLLSAALSSDFWLLMVES